MNNNPLLEELDITSPGHVSFISSLYDEEPYLIFEHNAFHVFASLSFGNKVFLLRGNGIRSVLVVKNDNTLLFFTPAISSWETFESTASIIGRHYGQNNVVIQNVSEHWVKQHNRRIQQLRLVTEPRSKEETVYLCDRLSSLSGSNFAELRRVRNSLIRGKKLIFSDVTNSNLDEAINILERWNAVQGHKYAKNKLEKEKYLIDIACKVKFLFPDLIFKIGRYEGTPISIVLCVKNMSRLWAVNYLVKGINRADEGGLHGASDATYLYTAQLLSESGITHINDGELGYEQGTREHKLRFKPIMFLKSFDINMPIA